jgi:hypothetical protein
MVSARSSSAQTITTPAASRCWISPGIGVPVEVRAARSRVMVDLARSGSPSRMVTLPRGILFGHNQWTYVRVIVSSMT